MSAPVLPWAKAPGDNLSAKLGLQRLNLLVIFNGLLRRRLVELPNVKRGLLLLLLELTTEQQ